MTARSRGWRTPEIAAAAALVALFVLSLVRSQAFDCVTFGGDEYYYLSWPLFSAAQLRATDPFQPELANHGYFALVRLAAHGGSPLQLLHLLAALLYAAGGALTILLARRFLDRLLSLCVGILWFLLPVGAYVSTAMPEPVYAGVFAAAAWVLVRRDGRLTPGVAFAGGLTIGLLYSVKPHAIAVLLAACAYAALGTLPPVEGSSPPVRRRAAAAALRVALVLAGFWAAAMLAAGFLGGRWSLSPGTLTGGVYLDAVSSTATPAFWSAHFLAIARYVGGHLSLLAMLFGVPAAVAARSAWTSIRRARAAGEPPEAPLAPALFAALVLGAAVAMTSIFTAFASRVSDEGNRLHVRYWSFALPLATIAGLAAMRGARSTAATRWGGAVALAGAAAFLGPVSSGFKLFPWDAADVLALFDVANRYFPWPDGPRGIREVAVACILAAGALAVLRPRWALPGAFVLWAVVFSLSGYTFFRWQERHVDRVQPLYREARAFSVLLRGSEPGSGVLVGRDRYGTMSYALAGLLNAPKVRVVEEETIAPGELPEGARWVVAVGPYVPGFRYESAIGGGALTLYLLDRGGSPLVHEGLAARVTERVELSLAEGQRGADLVGFNPAERWGSWTATPVATVILREALQGRYRMSVSGWTSAAGDGTPLRIRLGDREYAVPLGTKEGEHRLEVDVATAVDRFELLKVVPPHKPWEPPRGAAIRSISFTRAR